MWVGGTQDAELSSFIIPSFKIPIFLMIHWQSTSGEVSAIFGFEFVMQSGTADLHSNER
jgi:hypothetical protein